MRSQPTLSFSLTSKSVSDDPARYVTWTLKCTMHSKCDMLEKKLFSQPNDLHELYNNQINWMNNIYIILINYTLSKEHDHVRAITMFVTFMYHGRFYHLYGEDVFSEKLP